MSLCRVFIEGSDGKFYENPTIRGKENDLKWFLCFDDDDPPEFVIQVNTTKPYFEPDYRKAVRQILKENGINATISSKGHGPRTQRMFEGQFHKAVNYFIELNERIPVSLLKGYEPKDKWDGVLCGPFTQTPRRNDDFRTPSMGL